MFALRMVIFLYSGVPTILFIWLLPTFSRSTRQTTAPGVYLSSSTSGFDRETVEDPAIVELLP